MSGWVKLPCDEAAPFAALSLRARGLHATLWRRQHNGVLDAAAHELDGLAREIARRLGATAGDRRWIRDELAVLERAGYLARRGDSWVLVASDERPEPSTNSTRTEREFDTNRTRTEHEPNTKTDASPRNHSSANPPLSYSPQEREEKKREEGAPARTREGQPAAGGWWLDPWAVANRLRERSNGKLSLTLNGHERELSRTLATIAAQRPRLAEEFDHWAALVGRGEASWWTGALTIGALLGRPDETGKRTADGLIRCLEETSLRMPSKPAPLRVVPKREPQNLITPERAKELVEQARRDRAALRAAEEAAAVREAANG